MINLRYHIVSITAVFLALGIGIAMGSSFLSDAAVDQLDRNIESTRNEARAARAEAAELREEASRRSGWDEELHDQAAARLFRDHLVGVPVVLVTVGGVDKDSLGRLRTALEASGADFAGTITITGAVAVTGDDVDRVAEILGREEDSQAEVWSALVTGVADELLAAAEPAPDADGEEPAGSGSDSEETPRSGTPEEVTTTTDADPDEDDAAIPGLVQALVEEGVLDFEPAQEDVSVEGLLEDRGHRYVIVSGPDAEVPDESFIRPLLRVMTEDGPAPVVVASAAVGDDAEAEREAVIGPLLADDVVAARVSTVDHLESFPGLAAVMLSLDDLGRGRRGHYGVGDEAESQLPPP